MKNRSFKVGDEIICIQDHSRKLVLKGDVFTVKGFTRNPCCGSTIVDVGIKGPIQKLPAIHATVPMRNRKAVIGSQLTYFGKSKHHHRLLRINYPKQFRSAFASTRQPPYPNSSKHKKDNHDN
jgi:hypothetical protein